MTRDANPNAEDATHVVLRQVVWYGVRNVTVETLAHFEEWQRQTEVIPIARTVAVEELPDGRRNYAAEFYARDSYRVVWWFRERGIPVTLESPPRDPV